MRISPTLVSFSLFALLSLPSFAQTPPSGEPAAEKIPLFIIDGLHKLSDQSPEEAVKAWTRGADTDVQTWQADELRKFMMFSGAYQNFDVVSIQDITPRLRVIYLALNFEKRPNIVRLLLYKSSDGWVLIDHQFDIQAGIFEPLTLPVRR